MEKPSLWIKDFFIVTFTNFFLYFIHYLLISTITIFTIDQFHSSESMGGLAAGIFIIGMLFGRLFAGKSIEQVGQKKILFTGFIFSMITILLYFSIINLFILLLVRFLHGVAFGIASTATGTIVQHIIPDARRGEGTGYYGLSTTIAIAMGPFISILINQHLGFKTNFVICTVLIGICLFLSLFLKVPNVEFHKNSIEEEKGFDLSDFFELKAIPISIVALIVGFSYSSILSFLTAYAQKINLVNVASLFFIVYAIANLVSRPYTGKLFDIKGENTVVYPVLISFALGLFILSQAHQGFMFLLSGALIGIGYGTFVTSAQAIAVKESHPQRMGLATSTFFMFVDFGCGFGPFLLGFLIPVIGYRNLYITMAIVVLIAIVLYYYLHGKEKGNKGSLLEKAVG